MVEVDQGANLEKAMAFFDRAEEVAATDNFDYAIEMYLDGLATWPTALEEGHKPLRDIALRRQAAGVKKSGFGDKSKFKSLPVRSTNPFYQRLFP